MNALGLVVSEEKIFENCILKTYFLTLWPTYSTNWNHLNNFGRGPPRDHSCEVWWKSNEWFQRRRCLSKKVYARRTTHNGQRPVTIAHHEHFVLRWAKNVLSLQLTVLNSKKVNNLQCLIDQDANFAQILILLCTKERHETTLIHKWRLPTLSSIRRSLTISLETIVFIACENSSGHMLEMWPRATIDVM